MVLRPLINSKHAINYIERPEKEYNSQQNSKIKELRSDICAYMVLGYPLKSDEAAITPGFEELKWHIYKYQETATQKNYDQISALIWF